MRWSRSCTARCVASFGGGRAWARAQDSSSGLRPARAAGLTEAEPPVSGRRDYRATLHWTGEGVRAVVLKPGDRVVVEAESTERRPHGGVIEEVVREEPPRYRIRWDDGRESIYSPAAGALRKAESAKTG